MSVLHKMYIAYDIAKLYVLQVSSIMNLLSMSILHEVYV